MFGLNDVGASGSLATIRKILIVQMEMVLLNTDEKYCTRKDILMYFPVCENTYRKLEKLGRAPNVVGFDLKARQTSPFRAGKDSA